MAQEIPERTYTVGDEIRLEVGVVCAANVLSATAIFRREGSEVVRITLSGDVFPDESKTPPPTKYIVAFKAFRAELVTLVDIDHLPGTYRLDALFFTTESRPYLSADLEGLAEPVRFGIQAEPHMIESITARLIDSPASE